MVQVRHTGDGTGAAVRTGGRRTLLWLNWVSAASRLTGTAEPPQHHPPEICDDNRDSWIDILHTQTGTEVFAYFLLIHKYINVFQSQPFQVNPVQIIIQMLLELKLRDIGHGWKVCRRVFYCRSAVGRLLMTVYCRNNYSP